MPDDDVDTAAEAGPPLEAPAERQGGGLGARLGGGAVHGLNPAAAGEERDDAA